MWVDALLICLVLPLSGSSFAKLSYGIRHIQRGLSKAWCLTHCWRLRISPIHHLSLSNSTPSTYTSNLPSQKPIQTDSKLIQHCSTYFRLSEGDHSLIKTETHSLHHFLLPFSSIHFNSQASTCFAQFLPSEKIFIASVPRFHPLHVKCHWSSLTARLKETIFAFLRCSRLIDFDWG